MCACVCWENCALTFAVLRVEDVQTMLTSSLFIDNTEAQSSNSKHMNEYAYTHTHTHTILNLRIKGIMSAIQ